MNRDNELLSTVAGLAYNQKAKSLCNSYGVDVMSVTWEDTARSKNSCWGPNISDMTLNVTHGANPGRDMPLIRKPNFADVTSDMDINKFMVTVGNENGSALKRIPFKQYLDDIVNYTSNKNISKMRLDRDDKLLCSAQACVLPLRDGEVEFNVSLYNYQSYEDNPAVLVIVASAEGTSAQVVDNGKTSLRFNKNGKATNFVAKRLSEDRKDRGVETKGAMTTEEKQQNVLFIYQIPLKVAERPRLSYGNFYTEKLECMAIPACASIPKSLGMRCAGMEDAILKTGKEVGPFKGTKDLKLERDDRYPIRVTVQFYKVTDTSELKESDVKSISEQISKVYSTGCDVGSLVLNDKTARVTEPVLDQPYTVKLPEGPSLVFWE